MKFTLSLKELQLLCFIGILDHEKEEEQLIEIDIEIVKNLSLGAQSDCIDDTINYDYIAQLCLDIASLKKYALIEALAYAIFQKLWQSFSPSSLKIVLKKRSREDCAYASITIEQEE